MVIPTVKVEKNNVPVGEARPAEVVNETINVRIPLPADFAKVGDQLFVIHTKDNGTSYTHPVKVASDASGLYVEFANENGFSTFEVTETIKEAKIGTTEYATVEKAIAAATSGQTVDLLVSSEVADNIAINKGITLNLNGNELKVGSISAFKGNNVIDASNGAGRLVVNKDKVVLAEDNVAIPVYDRDCYRFFDVNMYQEDAKHAENSMSFLFKPLLADKHSAEYFADGAIDNDIDIRVRAEWTTPDGSHVEHDFIFADEFVKTVYGDPAFLQRFKITLNGVNNEAFGNLRVYSVMKSKAPNGAERTGEVINVVK